MDKSKTVEVKIIYPPAGFGLVKDAKILEKILLSLGYQVELCEFFSVESRSRVINSVFHLLEMCNFLRFWKTIQKNFGSKPIIVYIYLENLTYQKLFHNAIHILIPNQEWFRETDTALLPYVHEVWCKSLLAKNIFSGLGCKTVHTGFLSDNLNNQSLPSIRKEAFVSRVGKSAFRGVKMLVSTWAAHPEWPCLNIILNDSRRIFPCPHNINYVDEFAEPEDYQKFSSEFKFQIFATETEGFGHTIYEGVASGATVLLTDAQPMNEVLDNKSVVFIEAKYNGYKGLSPRFSVTKQGLEFSVKRALSLTDDERSVMAEHGKELVNQMEKLFISNLKKAMDRLTIQLNNK